MSTTNPNYDGSDYNTRTFFAPTTNRLKENGSVEYMNGEEQFHQHVKSCRLLSGAPWDYQEEASDEDDYEGAVEDHQYQPNDEDYNRIDEYYEHLKGSSPNDKLICNYYRPSFSTDLCVDAAILNTTPINVQDPVAFENNVAFLIVKPGILPYKLKSIENTIVTWRGKSKFEYNGDYGVTLLKCYLFHQDISPFIYDDWDFEEDIQVVWLRTTSVHWFVPLEHNQRKFMEDMASWTPDQPFNHEYLPDSYSEWCNEYMDTEPGKPPRRNHILESDYDSDSTHSSMPSLVSCSESEYDSEYDSDSTHSSMPSLEYYSASNRMDTSHDEDDQHSHFGLSRFQQNRSDGNVVPNWSLGRSVGEQWCDP